MAHQEVAEEGVSSSSGPVVNDLEPPQLARYPEASSPDCSEVRLTESVVQFLEQEARVLSASNPQKQSEGTVPPQLTELMNLSISLRMPSGSNTEGGCRGAPNYPCPAPVYFPSTSDSYVWPSPGPSMVPMPLNPGSAGWAHGHNSTVPYPCGMRVLMPGNSATHYHEISSMHPAAFPGFMRNDLTWNEFLASQYGQEPYWEQDPTNGDKGKKRIYRPYDRNQIKQILEEDHKREKHISSEDTEDDAEGPTPSEEDNLSVQPDDIRPIRRKPYSQVQLAYLERVYKRSPYIKIPQRDHLAAKLNLTKIQVRNWFQNRRIKHKHDMLKRSEKRKARFTAKLLDEMPDPPEKDLIVDPQMRMDGDESLWMDSDVDEEDDQEINLGFTDNRNVLKIQSPSTEDENNVVENASPKKAFTLSTTTASLAGSPVPYSGPNTPIYHAFPFLDEVGTEKHVEASDSTAFRCLDEAFAAGELSGAKVAQLKDKYMFLYDALNRTRENEFYFLHQAKRYTQTLEKQKTTLSKAEEFPDNSNTEVARLREQFLMLRTRLNTIQERGELLDMQYEVVRLEKRALQRDVVKLPQNEFEAISDDMDVMQVAEKRCRDLKKANQELQLQIENVQLQERKQLDSIKSFENHKKEIETELEGLKEVERQLENELVNAGGLTAHLSKEAERFRKQASECERELREKNEMFEKLQAELKVLQSRHQDLSNLDTQMKQTLSTNRELEASLEREMDECNARMLRESETTVLHRADNTAMEMKLQSATRELQRLRDQLAEEEKQNARVERDLDACRNKITKEANTLIIHQERLAKMQAEAEQEQNTDPRNLQQRRNDLNKEIQSLKTEVEAQKTKHNDQLTKIQGLKQELEQCFGELNEHSANLVELANTVEIYADERDKQIMDFVKAKKGYKNLAEEIIQKDLQVADYKKRYLDVSVKLRNFANLYEVMKVDRNQCVSLLYNTTTILTALKEKAKMAANEVECLKYKMDTMEKMAQKSSRRYDVAFRKRDQLKFALCKVAATLVQQKQQRELLKLNIRRQNRAVAQIEDYFIFLRKRRQRLEAQRNTLTIQLVELNEEVYILKEKLRVLDQMMQQGILEYQGRVDEIDFLQMQKTNDLRELHHMRMKLPQKMELNRKVADLLVELALAQDRRVKLEARAENPKEPGRLRFLPEEKMSLGELEKKMLHLEALVARREEYLLEKDLICEAVNRLVDSLRQEAMADKSFTLQLSKKVNNTKFRITTTTQKIHCLLAEHAISRIHCERLLACKRAMQRQITDLRHQIFGDVARAEDMSGEDEEEEEGEDEGSNSDDPTHPIKPLNSNTLRLPALLKKDAIGSGGPRKSNEVDVAVSNELVRRALGQNVLKQFADQFEEPSVIANDIATDQVFQIDNSTSSGSRKKGGYKKTSNSTSASSKCQKPIVDLLKLPDIQKAVNDKVKKKLYDYYTKCH